MVAHERNSLPTFIAFLALSMSDQFIQILSDHPTEVIEQFRVQYLDVLVEEDGEESDDDISVNSAKAYLQSIEDTEGSLAARLDSALRRDGSLEELIGTASYEALTSGLSRVCSQVVGRMDFFTLPIVSLLPTHKKRKLSLTLHRRRRHTSCGYSVQFVRCTRLKKKSSFSKRRLTR